MKPQTSAPHLRRLTGLALSVVLTATALGAVPVARADTKPTSSAVPATVSADSLPTWQLSKGVVDGTPTDGVVWSQVVVGTTVYATGDFTKARPPGAKAGATSEIDARNIFAYDITTGNPVPFAHQLSAAGQVIAASPDGKRVYVGGDFTTVDNQVHPHVAAFDTATGNLVATFAPSVDAQVKAITATNTTVYLGGSFDAVAKPTGGTVARKRLASFTTAGVLTSWAPKADDGRVWALVLTPDGSKVVVGGQFSTLNSVLVSGMGAVDATTGANLSWAASSVIKNFNNGGTDSLTTDGQYIYGSGYAYGSGGKFEGSFSLNPGDGSIRWLADCLGDTYDVEPVGAVVYTSSHAHDCTVVNGFPDTNPRTRWQRAGAFSNVAPFGVNIAPDVYGWNYQGQPAPAVLQWYPKFDAGKATGQDQAGWNVVSGAGYLAYGGEFPRVNGRGQQGLARFALAAAAPNKVGPSYLDTVPPRTAAPPTTASVVAPGAVRVTFGTAWDMDNQRLTYQVYRDRGTSSELLVATSMVNSNFWTLPNQAVTDPAVPAGSHTYQVRVTDPFGNEVFSPVSDPVVVDVLPGAYAAQVVADNANHFWRLGETSGPVYDSAGTIDGVAGTGVTRGTEAAQTSDTDLGATLDGTFNGIVQLGATPIPGPKTFSVEGWFKTTTTVGGKIVGFGSAKTGISPSYDRHVYLDRSGHLNFGVQANSPQVITSPAAYNDGNWHMFVATLGTTGIDLYLDGVRVARNTSATTAGNYSGYWRIGGDTMAGWANGSTNRYINASIDDISTYPEALQPSQVSTHWVKSGHAPVAAARARR